jgi:hypothetical protein
MRFEEKPLTHRYQPEDTFPESMRLDITVYNFLLENSYLIHNDNGYFALDELIDDSLNFFQAKFEQIVRKSLALMFQKEDSRKLSSRKKRLREILMTSFKDLRNFIQQLSSDHLLLVKIYATFFDYRIKLFIREGSSFKLRIFGEEGATCKVRLLYDSTMFYILVKKPEAPMTNLRRTQGSPSPVRYRSREPSHSPCRTIRILCEDLCGTLALKPKINSSKSTQMFQDPTSLCTHPRNVAHQHNKSVNVFCPDHDDCRCQRNAHSKSRIMESKTQKKVSGSINLKNSFYSVSSWTNLLNKLGQKTSPASPHKRAKNAPIKQVRSERGLLASYSASRQCGFIRMDNELEVIVIQDELLQAGVSENLLARSCNNIKHNVRFDLNLLSSEPLATFEARNLEFNNFFLK